jgi:hypothetical protein
LNGVTDLDNAPFIVDGEFKIYFEPEENKLEIMDMPVHGAENSETLDKNFFRCRRKFDNRFNQLITIDRH